MSLFRLAILVALAGFLSAAAQAAPEPAAVDVALVLAVDVSESVDADEYELQHEGIARAFETEGLLQAIRGGAHGAIDVLVLEWSDRDKQIVTVDWTRVSDTATAAAFAAQVRASKRSSHGLTAIGDALIAAAAALERLPDSADRRIIDVSGDGMANIGPPPEQVRDRLVASGVTINGLAILKSEPWLDSYYSQYVVGGAGGFLVQVDDFPSFIGAMQQKLITEISAVPGASRQAKLRLHRR